MTRLGGRLTVGVAVAVLVLSVSTALAQEARGRDVAELLPHNTTAYLQLANVQQVYAAMDASGLKGALEKTILREDPELTLEVMAWESILSKVRSLHVSFHGARVWGWDLVDLDVLAIADATLGDNPRAWLPPMLQLMLRDSRSFGKTKIYALAPPDLDDAPPFDLLLACVGGKVLFATDRMLLESTLEAMEGGRARSLANNDDYRAVTQGQTERDLLLYASAPGLLRTAAQCMDSRDYEEFEMTAVALGLRDFISAAYAQDYAGSVGTLRALMKPDSKLCRLLSQPSATRTIPDYLPEGVLMYAAANISDGSAVWPRLKDYICSLVIAAGDAKDEADFDELLEAGEVTQGVKFQEIASAVSGDFGIFFFQAGLREGIFATAKDAAKAGQLMKAIQVGAFPGEETVEDVSGVEVHTARDRYKRLRWAIVDNCVLASPRPEPVMACVAARKGGAALSGSPAYRQLAEKLHAESAYSFYLNLGALAASMAGFGTLPPPAAEWAMGLAVGASATVEDGLIEVRLAKNRDADLLDHCTLIRAFLEEP